MSKGRMRSGMTPLTFQILLALAGVDHLHGYGMIKEIEARGGDSAVPSTGALYLALQRLEEEQMIAEVPSRELGEDRRRRHYQITRKGREAAKVESQRLAVLVATARERALLDTAPAAPAEP